MKIELETRESENGFTQEFYDIEEDSFSVLLTPRKAKPAEKPTGAFPQDLEAWTRCLIIFAIGAFSLFLILSFHD